MNDTFFKKTVWLIAVAALTANLCFPVRAQQRGAGNVRVKDEQTGKTEEVKLYKASYALVIGVSDYTNGWQDLPGVRLDAEAVAAALQEQGFEVTSVLNPKKADLGEAIQKFINDYGYDYENRLLIYYAKHGNTQKSGAGYEQGFIVPADTPAPKAGNEAEFRRAAISMDTIERYAQEIDAKHVLFVFDSCFSGSLITKTRSPIPPIITFKAAQPVRQFITAGTDEQEVPDVSEFRRQFVAGIKGEADRNGDAFITASELADFLQDKVSRYTRGSQTPQYGKIRDARLDKGDFVFTPPAKATGGNTGDKNNPPPNDALIVAKTRAAQEREAWNLVKDGEDARDFRDFLKEFPDGANAGNAKIKLEQAVWDSVRASGEAARVKGYLDEFPNGANASAGRILYGQMTRPKTAPANDQSNPTDTNTTAAKTAGAISKARLPNGVEMIFAYIPAGNFQMGSLNGGTDLVVGIPQQRGAETVSALRNTSSLPITVNVTAITDKDEKISLPVNVAAKSFGEAVFKTSAKIVRVEVESDEKPVHKVRISQGFQMGTTEVTQGQWKAVMGELPTKCDYGSLSGELLGDNKPIICVSWDDAQQFIAKLNTQNGGYKYRLPSEAEWEYAARAGTTGDYAGNLDAMAWYSANAVSKTHEVGTKQANGWGLSDMHGNVWEWCEDWYEANYYAKSPATDPSGASSGSSRVSRGGGWSSDALHLRSSFRNSSSPSYHIFYLGFRVVRY